MALKNKKKVKPIPFFLALIMVLAAFAVMALFVVYLVVPVGNDSVESSEFSLDTESFEEVESSEPPPPPVVEVKDHMSDASVGDVVKFGVYDQNGNDDDGLEDIEWVVMEKQEEKLLLISRYALDCQRYNDERVSVEWKNSSLCKWLNGDFAKTAFSDEEINNIITDKNLGNVFVLSAEESEKYYQYDSWRVAMPTDSAKKNGVRVQNDGCFYWLRDVDDSFAKYVYSNGRISDSVFAVDYDIVGVRPAIWVSANTETDLDVSGEASQNSSSVSNETN